MNNILVFCEISEEQQIAEVSLELCSKARKLADRLNARLDAIVIGNEIKNIDIKEAAKKFLNDKVNTIEEAIEHINRYNSGHSESIITKDYANSQRFLDEVDAACVYVNASTRFTDGFEFGFGAEIGISTQKLHARGPMGLEALTSYKYIIYGDGQIRE